MANLTYVTKEDICDGFSDSQLEEMMRNMTIFMTMDGCPSPCDICALEANKSPSKAFDFDTIRWFFTTFAADFNRNQPDEHASDMFAYHGRDGETFIDILELHRDHHTYYPLPLTGFPKGAEEIIMQMLEMQFVNELHPDEDPNAQLAVPSISRQSRNQRRVDVFTYSLESSPAFVEREDKGDNILERRQHKYWLNTDYGVRTVKVFDIRAVPIGHGAKYADGVTGRPTYEISINPGVAVTPNGFFNYRGINYLYPELIRDRITPGNFFFHERTDSTMFACYDGKTGEVMHVPLSGDFKRGK